MTDHDISFMDVEKHIRAKSFGVLSAITPSGIPHSTGILYAVSPMEEPFSIYCITGEKTKKVRIIKKNPNVSFVITFPHYWLRFVPANAVTLQGVAELLPFGDPVADRALRTKGVLRARLKSEMPRGQRVIRINSGPKVLCYGIGFGVNELRKTPAIGSFSVMIPESRLSIPKSKI